MSSPAAVPAAAAVAGEPLRPLLQAVPAGTLLIEDRLDCSGAFLLPLLVRAAVQGGHKVGSPAPRRLRVPGSAAQQPACARRP
jgi:hypothetical protein